MLNSAPRLRLDNSQSKATRDTNTDVNRLVISPITSVAAKPFTAGVPKKNRKAHETTVVTCVSTSVSKAFENPAASAAAGGLAAAQLLANALENQHIAIHRHTDGEDHAGDSRQRQHRAEARQCGDQQHAVEQQRERRIGARPTVVKQHDRHHCRQSGRACLHSVANRIRAEGRLHRPRLHDFDGRGQRAGAQVHREILRLLEIARAANLARVANRVLNHRDAENLLIEHDRRTPPDVGPRVLLESRGRVLAQRERGDRLAHAIRGDTRVAQVRAPDDGPAARQQYQVCRPSAAGRVASSFRS